MPPQRASTSGKIARQIFSNYKKHLKQGPSSDGTVTLNLNAPALPARSAIARPVEKRQMIPIVVMDGDTSWRNTPASVFSDDAGSTDGDDRVSDSLGEAQSSSGPGLPLLDEEIASPIAVDVADDIVDLFAEETDVGRPMSPAF